MSFDLEIITTAKFDSTQLETFFASHQVFQPVGSLGEKSNVLVMRNTATKANPSFTIDGPFQVEPDDLAEEIVARTLHPQWLVQISVPASATKLDLKIASELSRFIADCCQGSVYDPQEGKVVWPRVKGSRYSMPSKEERIRLVTLRWFLPVSQRSSATASLMLQILRRTCPEALPTRFGTFEPLQNRLESGDDEPFLRMWDECRAVEYGDMFFWKAKSPFYGGHVSFPDFRDKFRPPSVERAIEISLSIDGRAIHADNRWCETVVTLFGAIASRLRAFFGMGYVQRDVIARRSIFLDGKSENSPTLGGKWWLGLPPTPTWLAWFGVGYAREVESSVSGFAPMITSDGILLRMGNDPMDRDQLAGLFPILPSDLIAQKQRDPINPASTIDYKPAAIIPPFE